MAEIPMQSSWRTPSQEMGLLKQVGEKKTQRLDGSVILDMEGLSLLVDPSMNGNTTPEAGAIASANTAPDAGASASPRAPAGSLNISNAKTILQKSLTRKVSQRGERKVAADGGVLLPNAAVTAAASGGGRGGAAQSSTAVPAAAAAAFPPTIAAPDKFVAWVLSPATAPEATTVAAASPRQATPCRRAHSRRATASWLDPRRVLIFFATLSSMGTIILLYFTLSMGKMGGGDADAR